MTQELKSCPFCGGDNISVETSREFSWTRCMTGGCSVEGPVVPGNADRAITAWNTRAGFATIPAPQAFMEAARGMREALQEAADLIGRPNTFSGLRVSDMVEINPSVSIGQVKKFATALATFDATLGEQ